MKIVKKPIQEVTIDATGKRFGRLATKVAFLLQGKNMPAYRPHNPVYARILVTNIDKMDMELSHLRNKAHYHSTMRPGGLKTSDFNRRFSADAHKTFRATVYGMLPKNKLRKLFIKNLHIT
ncbi:MAG: uL13 family ribosomal protein [Patescibacteria group bacterium]|jgi:large subunit ribosomal protein L13